ncbi:phage minor head protein [Geoalkalibacter halelectricus]|uniref:phage head morphogenesis protein n=1 Tax=Geoalkalibacter halelectricus TaxID=2847045 RepID=UPI003D24BFF0
MAGYGSLPFAEQIAFFRQKYPQLTAAWTDVYAAEHDHAFMVAGAAKADLLNDFRQAIDRAIAEGGTIERFRKDFDGIVDKHGWSYQGGRNWRTRVIFETNLRQSYHAGREAQMADPELKRRRPYALYRHGGSADPRPEHLAWDGLVLPVDDPWWDTHSPQNGWGCNCKKFMVGERDIERMGLKVGSAPPVVWEERVVGVRGPSPRAVRVPKGIDPGFEYRPGATRPEVVGAKLEGLDPVLGRAVVTDYLHGAPFTRFFAGDVATPSPVAVLDDAQRGLLGVRQRAVWLSQDGLLKNQGKLERSAGHPELTIDEYRLLPKVIGDAPFIVRKKDERWVFLEGGGKVYMAVVRVAGDSKNYLLSFRRSSLKDAVREAKTGEVVKNKKRW